MVIKTSKGMKPVNQLSDSDNFRMKILRADHNLPMDKIIANPDFLKDRYSSVGTAVDSWPHMSLVRAIDTRAALDDCEYIKRARTGTLDFRKKYRPACSFLMKRFNDKLGVIKRNGALDVYVCEVFDGAYMAVDGKHSLAMARYFGYGNINYRVVDNVIFEAYFMWIFGKIARDKDFTRHADFFRRSREFRKRQIDSIVKEGAGG